MVQPGRFRASSCGNLRHLRRQHGPPIELRGEFINLTNTTILNLPTRGIGTTLGLLEGSQGARNLQLALKYSF